MSGIIQLLPDSIANQIAAGELGDIQFISALQDQAWYRGTMGLWRQQLALSGGGQLNDSGSHIKIHVYDPLFNVS